jgi:tRNA(Arg) A34 adenosine deaminase TadA
MTKDEQHILRCIEIADECYSRGELPFGSVITYKGDVVAEGFNSGLSELTGHAEVNAMKSLRLDSPHIPFQEMAHFIQTLNLVQCVHI